MKYLLAVLLIILSSQAIADINGYKLITKQKDLRGENTSFIYQNKVNSDNIVLLTFGESPVRVDPTTEANKIIKYNKFDCKKYYKKTKGNRLEVYGTKCKVDGHTISNANAYIGNDFIIVVMSTHKISEEKSDEFIRQAIEDM